MYLYINLNKFDKSNCLAIFSLVIVFVVIKKNWYFFLFLLLLIFQNENSTKYLKYEKYCKLIANKETPLDLSFSICNKAIQFLESLQVPYSSQGKWHFSLGQVLVMQRTQSPSGLHYVKHLFIGREFGRRFEGIYGSFKAL